MIELLLHVTRLQTISKKLRENKIISLVLASAHGVVYR